MHPSVPLSLLERFATQVRVRPSEIACQCTRRGYTYAQLDSASERLAGRLIELGIKQGDRVAICMPKSSYCVEAILATVKAQAIYLPLDPEYPEDRLSMIAEDAGLKLILSTSDAHLPASLASVPTLSIDIELDDFGFAKLKNQCSNIPTTTQGIVEPNSAKHDLPVYMIYTSGSTGKPKGVVVGTRSTINFIDAMLALPGFKSTDVLLSASTLAFDISVYDVFVPLSAGGKIVIVDRDIARDGKLLAKELAENNATIMFATPSSWRMLIEAGWQGDKSKFRVFTGGEHLPRELIQPLLDRTSEVWNFYGPTEATVLVTRQRVLTASERILVGEPIENVELTVVDEQLSPVADEVEGELLITGTPLSHGYWNRPELDAERFIDFQGKRAYRTGDLCKRTHEGRIECLGRLDNQVKIRGHRIELGEIESAILEIPNVRQAVVVADTTLSGIARLVGYVVPETNHRVSTTEVLKHLAAKLPDYMVPAALVSLDALPLTPNGKIDRLALPKVSCQRPDLENGFVPASNELEAQLSNLWSELLGFDSIGVTDNFFQLGGNSLLAVKTTTAASEIVGRELPVALLFDHPTIRQWLGVATAFGKDDRSCNKAQIEQARTAQAREANEGIAIVGMSAKFPGAKNVAEFWNNLIEGVESIRFFEPHELSPTIPLFERTDKNYVAARGVIEDADQFDPRFFGISPREAEVIDPQHRILLELAWNALEDAGFNRQKCDDRVGVWAGCFSNTYLTNNLRSNPERLAELSEFQLATCTEKDFIATRIAHHLDLRGPAINVNTACSTSLVAVIEACKSLQHGDCEMALAGGSTVVFPQQRGHIYQSGNILSPDGHCRPFDAAADGTLFSDGAGLVVLKRYSDAVRDGDRVYAVIKGLGLNNDGGKKASFSAPSMLGQAAAIRMAHETAGVSADSIGYIEAHGTATPLGDPIEVAALSEAFHRSTSKKQFCALGSVKSNIGHCVAAAGVAGLIKAALSLHHQVIPATINFRKENAALQLQNSPFFVCDKNQTWTRTESTRYAGVSSFGVGGTNAHVVLSEAPVLDPALIDSSNNVASANPQPLQIWPLSAKTRVSLEKMETSYAKHAELHDLADLHAVATTLQHFREPFQHRSFAIVDSASSAASAFREKGKRVYGTSTAPSNRARTTWMFPGQGSQYAGMGRDLYAHLPVFRHWYDRCCEILLPIVGLDLRDLMLAQSDEDEAIDETLQNTRITQPAIYALSYSLAQVWLAAGLRPDRLIGHSIGEFVAATIAGVFDFEDALKLVATRGDLVSKLPRGQMLSVLASNDQLSAILPAGCEIAAVNAPKLCVAAGPSEAIATLMAILQEQNIGCRLLLTSHAFHSSMMDSAVDPFLQCIEATSRNAPRIPIQSTVTGEPLTDAEALSSRYWADHLRKPVLFSQTIAGLLPSDQPETFVEIGPRSTLVTLARKHVKASDSLHLLPSLSESAARNEELRSFLHAAGALWSIGNEIDWEVVSPASNRNASRFQGWLPEYPFDRKRLLIDPIVSENNSIQISSEKPSNRMSNEVKQDRTGNLLLVVREIFENASGIEIPESGVESSYLELGFDSLMLTQIAAALQRKFETEITFRQLLEQLQTAELLVQWLDGQLPEGKFAPEPSVATTAANAVTATASETPPTSVASKSVDSSIPKVASTISASISTPVVQTVPAAQPQAYVPVNAAPVNNVPVNSASTYAANPTFYTQPALATAPSTFQGNALQAIVQQQLQLMQSQLQMLSGSMISALSPVTFATTPAVQPIATQPIAIEQVTSQPVSAQPLSTQPASNNTNSSSTVAIGTSHPTSTKDSESPPESKKVFGAQARVSLQSAKIESEQDQKLKQFIQQYNSRTANSKAYAQKHRKQLADPRTVSGFQPATKEMTYPIVVERSKGAYVYDIDGHQYIDLTCGYGSNFFGHSPDFMVEALSKQIATGYEIGPQSVLTGEVAELFCEATGNERVAFCNTGSEAVLGALRLARTVTGRDKVVMFTGDYHGILDEVIVRPNKKHVSFPAAPGIPSSAVQNMVVLEYGTDETLQKIANEIDQYAAVIVESVQSRRPDYQPREFLHKLRQITENKPTALIFDEVITGFRAGLHGAQGYFGVEADLATYGKVIGGGMPIGVIAGKSQYMDALDGGFWQFGDDSRPEVGMTYFAGTFVRHPLALAAAKQTLLYLKRSAAEAYQHMQKISDKLEAGLLKLIAETGAPLRIARFCSLIKPEFTQESAFGDLLFAAARRRGLHVWEHRPWFLTLAHTEKDIDQVLQIMRDSIVEVQDLGFLPRVNQATPASSVAAVQPRQGKDRQGNPGWFIPDASNPGQFIQVQTPTL